MSDEDRWSQEYLARALEHAQTIARTRGYVRSTLPSWGLEETRPSLGSPAGTSEDTAVDVGTQNQVVESQPVDGDEDGDLLALRSAAEHKAGTWAKNPGMAAMHLKYRGAGSLNSMLATMIVRNDWQTPTCMGSIMAKWSQIVGATVAEHCHVETFEEHKLIVRCTSTAWAKQLHLLLPTIERRIDEEVGVGVVTQVIIRGPVAPSWRKGPLSVPGRGPRDTYG